MRPKRRPPRPKHPKFTHFHRSGLRFGRFPAQHRSIGGVGRPRRDRRAWLRCPWAVAGPGRIARQRAKPDLSTPGPTGVEGAEGSGGPGRGARGRWRGMAGLRDDAPISAPAPQVWRAPEGPEGLAAAPVGGGGAWPDRETTRQARSQYTRPHWCGGPRRVRRTWPRCRWAVAGPGQASRRRTEPENSDQAPLVWRAPEGPEGLAAAPVGGGGAWPGFEIDHSEPQARVWRSRGRAAAHGAARPNKAHEAPETPVAPNNDYDSSDSLRGSRRDRPR